MRFTALRGVSLAIALACTQAILATGYAGCVCDPGPAPMADMGSGAQHHGHPGPAPSHQHLPCSQSTTPADCAGMAGCLMISLAPQQVHASRQAMPHRAMLPERTASVPSVVRSTESPPPRA